MKSYFHKLKMNLLCKITNPYSILFHIIGIICIIWFLVRVVPKPDRINYPCQQMSIAVAMGYITFWIILWSALFHGLGIWMKKVKYNFAKFAPVILVCFLLIFSVSSNVFADINYDENEKLVSWDPIPKEPIGTPKGENPGRVVWVWNPEATEKDLSGYWWNIENNDQTVIDQMFSYGLQSLAGVNNDYSAWDLIFIYFNQVHGHGDIGYQPGEKIAIKVNFNNCQSYSTEDNDRDASPFVVKSLLRQLVNVVGVEQDDITIYDATRPIGNWFYNRVYYKEYPASPLVPEFADVHFVDSDGGASGREKVIASSERVYFAAGPCEYRTLPTVVANADYLINMPILKRHPYGVTLSGKNFFGTWIESVESVHEYLFSSLILGNPAPQTDLLAHENIGGKTILYIGDGIFATKVNHRTIAKFLMYPFNNDWTNSLFFSQDPVAIDSVMYDFLLTEGTNPDEGAQNYLHQSAEPLQNVYDPENDGIYLSDSLGVHEHWDTSEDIFSSKRYSGPINNGIDYITTLQEENFKIDADGPYFGFINNPVKFNGNASGGYPPYNWHWDFGDGYSSEEQNPTHTYTSTGNYIVILTVTDYSSNTSSDTTYAWIQVTNGPPNNLVIEGPNTGKVGTSYDYTFKVDDPEGAIIWYYIEWGDNTNSGWLGPFESGEEIVNSHAWSSQGSYTIRAKAKDPYNDEGPWGTLDVTMPRSKIITNSLFFSFLERFTNLFPILQKFFQHY